MRGQVHLFDLNVPSFSKSMLVVGTKHGFLWLEYNKPTINTTYIYLYMCSSTHVCINIFQLSCSQGKTYIMQLQLCFLIYSNTRIQCEHPYHPIKVIQLLTFLYSSMFLECVVKSRGVEKVIYRWTLHSSEKDPIVTESLMGLWYRVDPWIEISNKV